MDPTQAGLLAAIANDPDVALNRLVYADWLEENSKVPCPDCGGGRPGLWVFQTDDELRCVRCGKRGVSGDGLVDDGSRARLAEGYRRLAYNVKRPLAYVPVVARGLGYVWFDEEQSISGDDPPSDLPQGWFNRLAGGELILSGFGRSYDTRQEAEDAAAWAWSKSDAAVPQGAPVEEQEGAEGDREVPAA